MAYYKNWRKRKAEVQALAEGLSSSEDAREVVWASAIEEGAATLSPLEDVTGTISDYDSGTLPLSSDIDSDQEAFDSMSDNSGEETEPDLSEEVAAWATRNCLKRSALNDLFDLFRRQGHRLPKDARTLLQTPKKVATVEKCGGHYAYFGLASGIVKILAQNRGFREDSIGIFLNIDGVPRFKSTNMQMWPILCSFHNFAPFIAAMYCGKAKPNKPEEYLSDFLTELEQLLRDGIVHGQKTLRLIVKAFVCDAPARAFLKCIKNHNSYYACKRCTIRGTYIDGRVFLGATEPGITLRSEVEFSRFGYNNHQIAKSPLSMAGIPCIKPFALDYMHLVCLGVVRRMLHWMKSGPATCKLSFQQRSEISDHLTELSGQLPSEFARQPRSLLELDQWKATELRQFLLYTSTVDWL